MISKIKKFFFALFISIFLFYVFSIIILIPFMFIILEDIQQAFGIVIAMLFVLVGLASIWSMIRDSIKEF